MVHGATGGSNKLANLLTIIELLEYEFHLLGSSMKMRLL